MSGRSHSRTRAKEKRRSRDLARRKGEGASAPPAPALSDSRPAVTYTHGRFSTGSAEPVDNSEETWDA